MKKYVLTLWLVAGSTVYACDFCNCYLGLNPHFKKNTIGFRYHQMNLSGSHFDALDLNEMNISNNDFKETRQIFEFTGQFYPTQKLQIIVSLPFANNVHHAPEMNENDGHTHSHSNNSSLNHNPVSGIADPLIIGNYQLLNKKSANDKVQHRVLAGLGIKLPIGKYKAINPADLMERTHLPGTGNLGTLANGTYLVKISKIGFNTTINFMINNKNTQNYKIGNRLNINSLCYLPLTSGNFNFYPNIGLFYERADYDRYQDNIVGSSGGSQIMSHIGFDTYFKALSLNLAIQNPLIQNLNGYQPSMSTKILAGISLAFN